MTKETCPQPDYPLRERAYAPGQMDSTGKCPHCGHKPVGAGYVDVPAEALMQKAIEAFRNAHARVWDAEAQAENEGRPHNVWKVRDNAVRAGLIAAFGVKP